jgi:Tfp pilus assembly protein PilF
MAGGAALVVVAALTLGACSAARSQPPEVQRLQARAAFERGLKHFNDREPTQALAALREATALDETSAVYRDTLGLVFTELQRPDLATEQFRHAVALDPQYADAHFHLGVALAEAARWESAAAAYRKALSLPTLTVPHFAHQNLGLALYHLRQYREAEEQLRFAIGLEPQMGLAYYNLGLVLAAQGRREDARVAFSRARDLGPETPFGEAARDRLRALGEEGPNR